MMECSAKMGFWALLFVLLFTLSTGSEGTSAEEKDPKIRFSPSNYVLEIRTTDDHFKDDESKAATFNGTVTVTFKIEKPDGFDKDFDIVLNADNQTKISELVLKGFDGETLTDIETVSHNIINSKLVIKCKKDALKYQGFQLKVTFSNPFGKDMSGFYRSSYKDSKGKTRWLLTTHFEPIYARRAFPCFDEPDLKATFDIQITAPKDFATVLSNTALKETVDVEGSKKHIFKNTAIPMSTYLVAFTVSDFKGTEPVKFSSDYPSKSERTLRTYGRADIIDKGDAKLAQTAGKEAVVKLGEYMGLGYAFEKVDQVGIPDFSAGAMENWGHISFREKALYFNEVHSSTVTKQSNILTITHELVHQWFGNLVTLQTWDYVWLNEAFANYFEYVIASQFALTSEWDLMKQMVVNEMHLRAFETDGYYSSKPLNNKITDENLIFSSFNDIPYAKGASVLRMWDLGHKKGEFQKSLQDYIKQRQKSFANPTHLYESFKKHAEMNESIFKTWTDQAGYPVVEVKEKDGKYELTQSRFLWGNETDKSVWRIPITYSTDILKNFDTLPSIWLDKDKLTIEAKCKWIIVNNHQAGYYRVNYDLKNWEALSLALSQKNYSGIPELNRAQIINDVFSLARSLQKEYVKYSTALALSEYLKKEISFVTWKTALNAFDFLQNKLYQHSVFDKFKSHVTSLVSPHLKSFKETKLNHIDKLMNIQISRWACALDYEPCVKEAMDIFKVSNFTAFPDTQEIILCTAVRKNSSAWGALFDNYKKEQDSAIKIMYLTALGCTTDKNKAEEFLKMTLNSSDIRKQDLTYVLSAVYNGNFDNVEITFKFIETNYEEIAKNYGGINPLGKAVVGIAKKLNTNEQVKRLQELVKKIGKLPEGKPAEESLQTALKVAASNIDWNKQKLEQINKYFNSSSIVSFSFVLLLVCLISVLVA